MEITDTPYCDSTTFGKIWLVVFPKCLLRKQKDIPGTCKTCFLIDNGRKTNQDAYILNKFKEAHLLHRGGHFMLERNQ